MADSIYYNSGKYYNLSGSLFTSLVSGDKKGTVVTDPAKTAGMFKNTVNAIDMSKNIDKQLRNADGTINMNSLYETTGSYASMGARFNVANQMISVSSKNSSSEVTKPEETTKAQETTKATEGTTKETQAPTKATESTTKETQTPTKATESTTKETQAPTKATEASSVSTKGEKLILNANDVSTGKIKSSTVVDGLKILATSKKTVTVDKSDKDYKNISFTKRIKLGGAGSESARAIAFKTAGESKVKIYATSSDTNTSRLIKIIDKNGNDVTSTAKIPGSSLKSVSFRLDEAGEYYIVSESGGVNIYYVEVSNGIAY